MDAAVFLDQKRVNVCEHTTSLTLVQIKLCPKMEILCGTEKAMLQTEFKRNNSQTIHKSYRYYKALHNNRHIYPNKQELHQSMK